MVLAVSEHTSCSRTQQILVSRELHAEVIEEVRYEPLGASD